MRIELYTNNLEAILENGQLFINYFYGNILNIITLINF